MPYNIGSTLGQGKSRNLSIDFKSSLGLSQQIGYVTIDCTNKALSDAIESSVKRCINKFNKEKV